ncbi:MAG: hypothetical protein GYB33_21950 [Gammaproteobacteria bacterium]|nr:hypothetical protein [Gammaproteobacteria bacterium]
MLPSIDVRIENLIKAMETIVSPAIDPANDLAREQSSLIVGHLKLLKSQWDFAYIYEQQALEEMMLLADVLVVTADGGPRTMAAKRALQTVVGSVPKDMPRTSAGISQVTASIGNAVDEQIYACHDDGSPCFRKSLADNILASGEKQVLRERIWFQATGLDPERERLFSIEEKFLS